MDGDFNGDGTPDILDLDILGSHWGGAASSPATWGQPAEPELILASVEATEPTIGESDAPLEPAHSFQLVGPRRAHKAAAVARNVDALATVSVDLDVRRASRARGAAVGAGLQVERRVEMQSEAAESLGEPVLLELNALKLTDLDPLAV